MRASLIREAELIHFRESLEISLFTEQACRSQILKGLLEDVTWIPTCDVLPDDAVRKGRIGKDEWREMAADLR